MEENVKKEVETIRQMMRNWKRGFLTWYSPGNNEYILDEFKGEITDQLLPYVYRLMQSGHLTDGEARALMDECYGEVGKLRKELEALDGGI